MFKRAGFLYLGSRATSAVGNLLALAIFSRLAGPAEYGHYLLIFTWSIIIYGFGVQWMRYAYFGVYQTRRIDEYVASLAQLLGIALLVLGAGFACMALLRTFEPLFLLAVFALICGMAVYEAAFEVTRTLLNARLAAFSMMLRTCLVISLGSVTLWLGGGTTGLAFAVAFAHLFAAIPCLFPLAGRTLAHGSRHASLHIVRYGWPLLLSFGAGIAGLTIDRLLLAHYAGPAALGPYGAVGDILRQTFIVFAEAIMLSLVTVAKQHANDGDIDSSNHVLQKAFNASVATAAFGAAFFFVFGEPLLRILLNPDYLAPSRELVPIFAVAFAFMTMRSYFAQVIFLTDASYLDLVVSVLSLIVSTVLSILLVPTYGPMGAAISLMIGCIVACIAFMIIGRRHYRLPIDLVGLGAILTLAGLFVLSANEAARLSANVHLVLVFDGTLFAALTGYCVYRFGLLHSSSGEPSAPHVGLYSRATIH
jgi:O-antigen/teichoic acid export membrane protein